jgi:hypothetical protein
MKSKGLKWIETVPVLNIKVVIEHSKTWAVKCRLVHSKNEYKYNIFELMNLIIKDAILVFLALLGEIQCQKATMSFNWLRCNVYRVLVKFLVIVAYYTEGKARS